MTDNTVDKKNEKVEEIDLVEVFKKIWDGRKIIYKTVGIFLILGIIIAFGTPKEYKSEITLLIENTSGTSAINGLLQQFGGFAGINLGTSNKQDALTPEIYPDILKSTPFLLEILDKKVTIAKNDSALKISEFLEYHTKPSLIAKIKKYTIGLPFLVIDLLKGEADNQTPINTIQSGPLKLSQKQTDMMGALAGRIAASEGESENTLSISVEMQDPLIAALLADTVLKSLTRYIIDYRTQKAKVDLKFVEERHKDAEGRYQKAQQALASFQDQNRNMILASAKTMEQKLQAEYTLAFNVYNGLSQQLEQSKLKVQEKTPVFKVINPSMVSLRKSKPKTSIILISMIFLGGISGIGVIFGRTVLKNFKKTGKL